MISGAGSLIFVILKRWGSFFPHTILNEISIQIKNGSGKIYPILPDNELSTFWQIIYTPCMLSILLKLDFGTILWTKSMFSSVPECPASGT
jgi:hypothetical protein